MRPVPLAVQTPRPRLLRRINPMLCRNFRITIAPSSSSISSRTTIGTALAHSGPGPLNTWLAATRTPASRSRNHARQPTIAELHACLRSGRGQAEVPPAKLASLEMLPEILRGIQDAVNVSPVSARKAQRIQIKISLPSGLSLRGRPHSRRAPSGKVHAPHRRRITASPSPSTADVHLLSLCRCACRSVFQSWGLYGCRAPAPLRTASPDRPPNRRLP
jgi:hypothetical protein